MEGFSKLVSNFKGASLNFECDFFYQVRNKKIVRTISARAESTYIYYYKTSKIYSSHGTIPLRCLSPSSCLGRAAAESLLEDCLGMLCDIE